MSLVLIGGTIGLGNDNNTDILIQVKNLKKCFKLAGRRLLHAVDDVSFDVERGKTLGLVGESGCGKSTVGNVIMGLLSPTGGQVIMEGMSVFEATGSQKNELKRKMQIIFQDPYSSLNPRKTVRSILSEGYLVQKIASGKELEQTLHKLCDTVGIAHELLDYYPHELDGGMR